MISLLLTPVLSEPLRIFNDAGCKELSKLAVLELNTCGKDVNQNSSFYYQPICANQTLMMDYYGPLANCEKKSKRLLQHVAKDGSGCRALVIQNVSYYVSQTCEQGLLSKLPNDALQATISFSLLMLAIL